MRESGDILLEKTCPECGAQLITREGRFGEFSGCSNYPLCRYTESEADIEKIYQSPSPFCGKCNHTGLIPFIKNGKIIPNTFLFCECHEEHEYHSSSKPSNFDFPMSYGVYRSLCQQYGWNDLGPDRPSEPVKPQPREQVIVHRHSNISKQDYDLLQQTARRVAYLEKKLAKPAQKTKQSYEPF